jgi:hypothetical protein
MEAATQLFFSARFVRPGHLTSPHLDTGRKAGDATLVLVVPLVSVEVPLPGGPPRERMGGWKRVWTRRH